MSHKEDFNRVLSELTGDKYVTDLVLAGGAYYALAELGVIQEYIASGIKPLFVPERLKHIYGTSVGSILAVLFTLNIPLDEIVNYVVHRPWSQMFEFQPQKLFSLFKLKSLYSNKETIEEMLKPFFNALDIDIETFTMRDMYERTRKTTYIYTASLYGFQLMEISYKTHPDLLVARAVSMSSAIPLIFEPIKYDGHCYMDGGTCMNYPLEPCLKRANINSRILGVRINYLKSENVEEEEPEIKTMWESLFVFFSQAINKTFSTFDKEFDYQHLYEIHASHIKEYVIDTRTGSHFEYLTKLLYSAEERQNFMNYGKEVFTKTNAGTQQVSHRTPEHHIELFSHPAE